MTKLPKWTIDAIAELQGAAQDTLNACYRGYGKDELGNLENALDGMRRAMEEHGYEWTDA